jgi:hypothetical protein
MRVRSLSVLFGARDLNNGASVRARVEFGKRHDDRGGRHSTTASVLVLNALTGKFQPYAQGWARLGKGDVGHYSFFAGARIAFSRVLVLLRDSCGWDPDLVRTFRRSVQIELSLAENDEVGCITYGKLKNLKAQREALLVMKRVFMESEKLPGLYPVPPEPVPDFEPQPDLWAPHGQGTPEPRPKSECAGDPTCCAKHGEVI